MVDTSTTRCSYCGDVHPSYSPCVEPPVLQAGERLDKSQDGQPEVFAPILDGNQGPTGYFTGLRHGGTFTFDDEDAQP